MADNHTQFGPGEFRPDGALEHGVLEGGARPGGRLVPALLIAAISASGLSMLFSVGTAVASAKAKAGEVPPVMQGDLPEEEVSLGVQLRTFAPFDAEGGHPDFERFSGSVRVGLVAEKLGPDGLPTLGSRHGASIEREFTDGAGRPIRPALFRPGTNDRAGELNDRPDPRVFSDDSFAGWFSGSYQTDTSLVLARMPGEDRFVFDSDRSRGVLPGGLHTGVIRAVATVPENGRLGVSSADDAWVFIDGQLAIDLGSAHPRRMQWIDFDRIGVAPGRNVSVDVFFAERRSGDQHLRIETNARLRPAGTDTARGAGEGPAHAG